MSEKKWWCPKCRFSFDFEEEDEDCACVCECGGKCVALTEPPPEPRDDGGPAFPSPIFVLTQEHAGDPARLDLSGLEGIPKGPGISIRDYFLAHAPEAPGWFEPAIELEEKRFFAWREHYADEMIRRRKG